MKKNTLFLLAVATSLYAESLPDSIYTKLGEAYPCYIKEISTSEIVFLLPSEIVSKVAIEKVSKVVLDELGIVYLTDVGFAKSTQFLKKYIEKREKELAGVKQFVNGFSYRPGDHELLIMPTAYTMEKGKMYFSDYELFFLNYTAAVTPSTHIGIFTLFPIVGEFIETVSLGAKQRWLNYEKVKSAVWATYMIKEAEYMFGNVFSVGSPRKGFHLGFAGSSASSKTRFIYLFGGNIDVGKSGSLMLEFSNFNHLSNGDFLGFVTFGFRFRGKKIAWDFGAIRPLVERANDDFLFFPLLKATVLFGGNQ